MSENSLTITINPQDLLTALYNNLTVCSNSVFIGLAMLNDLQKLPEFIPGEDDFSVHKPFAELSLDSGKKIFRDWIIKKGFEDLIKGVSEMLVDYCNIINKSEKIKTISSAQELQDLIYTPDEEVAKMHLPGLLDLVKTKVNAVLEYEDCIETINQVRNCLVHRNGIVTLKDTKKQDKLTLKWGHFRLVIANEGEEDQPMEQFAILRSTSKIIAAPVKKEKEFKLNEHIEITYQEFNEIKDTCVLFAQDLLSKFNLNMN